MPELWNKSQRLFLAILILIACIALAVRNHQRPALIRDPQPESGPRAGELIAKLNPNTAPWEQLSILPNLSEERAKHIIAYRMRYTSDHPGEVAFKKPEDLLRVSGIGVAMLDTLEPYLIFDSRPKSTTLP